MVTTSSIEKIMNYRVKHGNNSTKTRNGFDEY